MNLLLNDTCYFSPVFFFGPQISYEPPAHSLKNRASCWCDFPAVMTEKMFYCIELSRQRHIALFSSVIKALMTPWDIPRTVNSHVTVQPPLLGRNLGERLTCHCVSCEVMAFRRVFWCRALCIMIMIYCFIVMFYCVTSNCVFSGFLLQPGIKLRQWKWLLCLFCSLPQFSAGRWDTFVKSKLHPD